MSTLSAQLLISSSSITEDFYKGFIRPNASEKRARMAWQNYGVSYCRTCYLDRTR